MIVKCMSMRSSSMPDSYISAFIPSANNERVWNLIEGKNYIVYSICFFSSHVLYLLMLEDASGPQFVPAPLFNLQSQNIPSCWKYYAVDKFIDNNMQAVFGYPEMVDGSGHLDDLEDGKNNALATFLQRKKEIDYEEELLYYENYNS